MEKFLGHLAAAAQELGKMITPGIATTGIKASKEEILLDNEHGRLIHSFIPPGVTHVAPARGPRFVYQINSNSKHHVVTTNNHSQQVESATLHRVAGHTHFREASDGHVITNTGTEPIETLIFEIKK